MGVTTRLYSEGRLQEKGFDPDLVDQVLSDPTSVIWLDVDDPTPESMELLRREFGFHELALEDALQPHQRPKIEQYESYFFVIAYGISVADGILTEHEMGIFVGRNYLVTVRKPPGYDLTMVMARWDVDSKLCTEGGGYLLYILLDEIVDRYFEAIDTYEERSEDIEDRVFGANVDTSTQNEIFRLKKDLLKFRREVAPLRDVVDVLQRRTVDVVTIPLEPYYRDVYDHVLRVTDYVDSIRDLLSSALEANLSVVSNRLNEVMKVLTSWAAIILVPTLIAGIYGMNFIHMPELKWKFGYAWALGLMAASGFALYRMFKKRGWL
jgi:magnesium transporter